MQTFSHSCERATQVCGANRMPVAGAISATTWGAPNSPRYLCLILQAPTPSRCQVKRHALLVHWNKRPCGLLLRRCPHFGQVLDVCRSSCSSTTIPSCSALYVSRCRTCPCDH